MNTLKILAGWDFENTDAKRAVLRSASLPESLAEVNWSHIPADNQLTLIKLITGKPRQLKEFAVVIKVMATDCRDAVEMAYQRLNTGGEPDAVLTCPVSFPDPEIEGATVTL